MKTIFVYILLLVLMFFGVSRYGSADIHGELEAGYNLNADLWEFSVEVDIGQQIWEVYPHVFAGWYTLTQFSTLSEWLPWVQVYKVGAGVWLGDHIDLTYTHYCMHPVDLGRDVFFDYDDFVLQSADKISVRYRW